MESMVMSALKMTRKALTRCVTSCVLVMGVLPVAVLERKLLVRLSSPFTRKEEAEPEKDEEERGESGAREEAVRYPSRLMAKAAHTWKPTNRKPCMAAR